MLPPPCSTWRMIWSSVMREAMESSAGPRMPPAPPMEWQLRHCLFCRTSAPCRSSGVRSLQVGDGNGIAGPGVHDRAPRRVHAEAGEDAEGDSDDRNHQHGHRTARPMLFAFAGDKRKQQHGADDEHGRDEKHGSFEAGRQIGEDGVDPEEGEVGLGRGLDDGGVGLARGAEGAEQERAGHDGKQNGRGEDGVLPCGVGNEGNAGLLGEFVVFLHVGLLADDAAGHGPVVDAEAQHHPEMQADERRAGCRE